MVALIRHGLCLFILFFFVVAAMASPNTEKYPDRDGTSHPEKDHQRASQKDHPTLSRQDAPHEQDPYFSTVPPTVYKTFQLILEAKSPDNLAQAVLKTKQLTTQKGVVGETASFLLGDLYLRQAQGGDQQKIDDALRAFSVAVRNYPKSENVTKAVLKKGDIYFSRKLYPEALGNYHRVSEASNPYYAGLAHVGLAKSFQAWRRWEDALKIVKKSSTFPLSPEDQKRMALIQADTVYQQGKFEEAFQAYKPLLPPGRPYPEDPIFMFGYAESAYRTGRTDTMRAEMKELLRVAYDRDTQGPVAPLALGRLHTLLKMDGEITDAEKAADAVYAVMPHVTAGKTGKVMVAASNLALMTCPNPCKEGVAQLNLEQLAKVSKSLLGDVPFTITAQGAVFDGLEQLKRYERFDAAEEVFKLMVMVLPSATISPYYLPTKKRFKETVLAHFESDDNPKTRVRLYRRFRWAFEDQMAEETGLKIAKSYLKLNDFATALNLLHPIARNKHSSSAKEALHLKATLLAKIGDYEEAKKAFVAYRVQYPDQHGVLTELAEVYNRLEMFESAAVTYETWLNLLPQDSKRHNIYQKLADIYQRTKDFPSQVRTYQAWIKEIPKEADRPYTELAEAYYQDGQIKKAIEYYERGLTFETDQQEIDWGLLHLADAYLKNEQIGQAEAIYKEVEKRAQNPLLKQAATEKRRSGVNYHSVKKS